MGAQQRKVGAQQASDRDRLTPTLLAIFTPVVIIIITVIAIFIHVIVVAIIVTLSNVAFTVGYCFCHQQEN